MEKKEVLEYIEKELKQGFKLDAIKSALIEAGHDIELIEGSILHFKNKKKLSKITTGLLVLVIAAVVVITVINLSLKLGEEAVVTKEEKPEIDQTSSDRTMFLRAINTKDSSLCEEIANDEIKEECVYVTVTRPLVQPAISEEDGNDRNNLQKAINTADSSVCDDIVDAEVKQECLDVTSAKKEAAEEEAEAAVNKDDRLLLIQAISTGDAAYCNQIINEEVKTECFDATKS